ncbi:rhodanese-like domain-containing protein [bacterium]|nr:rhodanese-like domain-containing protein [bacterium]MBU1959041.1 rhodanese-like domain-containing protein [bacterium]
MADENLSNLQYDGVEVVTINEKGEKEEVYIEREIADICERDVAMKAKTIWGGNYAHKDVPTACQVSFVTSVGKISPMSLHKDVETYGELEVLAYLKKMAKDNTMLFIDSRAEKWFQELTIPSAINISFLYFIDQKKYAKEFAQSLKTLGVRKTKEAYDFTKAKTILLFCNGAWCGQSPHMIKELLAIGYPAEKIKWYRGGMQSWLGLGMTSTREKVE